MSRLSYAEIVGQDPERALASLFAPRHRRPDLWALIGFSAELARVRARVSEPLLGQIRLRWWQDGLDEIYAGGAHRRHPVLDALAPVIRTGNLSPDLFARMIEGRERDLLDEPPPDMAALNACLDSVHGSLASLQLAALGANTPQANGAAREIAIAGGLCDLLRGLPLRTQQAFIPHDIQRETGFDAVEFAGGGATPELIAVAERLALAATSHLDAAARAARGLPRRVFPALATARLSRHYLRRLAAARFDPFAVSLQRPDTLAGWRLLRGYVTNRY